MKRYDTPMYLLELISWHLQLMPDQGVSDYFVVVDVVVDDAADVDVWIFQRVYANRHH